MSNQLKILVKRADGTTVRMTMDELKRMKPKAKSQEYSPKLGERREERGEIKDKKSTMKLALNTDNLASAWEADDHKSLLDAEFHKVSPVLVKDGEHILARTAPVRDIFVREARYRALPSRLTSEIKLPPPRRTAERAPGLIAPAPKPLAAKPVMHDIQPPNPDKVSVGPVDELNKFTLEDWRRLDVSPEAAGEKLREKFGFLEADSFLLFMDGVEAWYNSPLYRQYQQMLLLSLKQEVKVEAVLGAVVGKGLNFNEFRAILKLNQSLY